MYSASMTIDEDAGSLTHTGAFSMSSNGLVIYTMLMTETTLVAWLTANGNDALMKTTRVIGKSLMQQMAFLSQHELWTLDRTCKRRSFFDNADVNEGRYDSNHGLRSNWS